MREYEVVFIVQPDLDETAFNGVVEKVKGWIVDSGGTIDKIETWGKRKLAYHIRKQRDGLYMFIKAQMSPEFTQELDRNMRFLEPVMRYLITVVE
ncbi:MAG TPA: 30S ribosomal protein S6 [Longilinea sp.]|nr:30S ribosomal protein S6 [Longilinea sp.]